MIDKFSSWFGAERWHNVPKCGDGKQPSRSDYVQYLFIRDRIGANLIPVGKYPTVKNFTEAIREYDAECETAAKDARKRRTLLSMAPSATQAEAGEKGFHILRFQIDDSSKRIQDVVVEHHQYVNKSYEVSARSFRLASG